MAKVVKDPLLDYGLVVLVFLLMLGLGATLLPHQFLRALRNPKPLLVGVLSQYMIMPHIALLLAEIFDLPAAVAVGLLIVGCTPGGSTSNLFAFWSGGDVALSIAMTGFRYAFLLFHIRGVHTDHCPSPPCNPFPLQHANWHYRDASTASAVHFVVHGYNQRIQIY
jgi:ACR3 family arsenite efflux pump ArsB